MYTKYIMGTKVNLGLSMKDVLSLVQEFLNGDKCHYISTTNPEFIVQAAKDIEFKNLINTADLSLPDGVGILYASKYLDVMQDVKRDVLFLPKAFFYGIWLGLFGGRLLGERISGVELVYNLCELASRKKYTIFLLGGRPKDFFGRFKKNTYDLAVRTAACLRYRYPGIRIVGASSQFSYKSVDDASSVDFIKECMRKEGISHIDLLYVAYGHGKQERWIARNAHKLPAKVAIGVGGTFDYIAGVKKQAPIEVRRCGLEWLYRIATQPWRVKRVLTAFPLFPLLIFIDSLEHDKG